MPIVTVLMSVRNCEATIGRSVKSIINQSLDDWRLVIVDDGSTDSTPEIISRFSDPRITFLREATSKGVGARINQVISGVASKYVARMDGDDICYPDRLARQVEALERNPKIDLLATSVVLIDHEDVIFGYRPCPPTHSEICARPWARFPMPQPTWMGKTDWFKKNPYHLRSFGMEDYDLLLRTYKTSSFACLPECLVAYRETSLYLRKSFIARKNMSRSLLRNVPVFQLVIALPLQLILACLDFAAISTGLRYKLLRHRIRHAPPEVVVRWEQVQAMVAS
jgi:glycosyltransferase involved in cell wall biosynthesis